MKALPFLLLLLLLSIPALAKDKTAWKSEADFRKATPEVHRKALWLEENANAETWGDSLKYVLTWGREVPYVTLGTADALEKEVVNLPKDRVAGRISTMLLVGYIQLATEPEFKKATEFEMAKAGFTCMIRYYGKVKALDANYSIPYMDRLSGLHESDALDEYLRAKLRH